MLLELFLHKNLALHLYYSEKSLKNNKVIVKNIYLMASGLPQFTHRNFFKDKVSEDTAFFYLYYYKRKKLNAKTLHVHRFYHRK